MINQYEPKDVPWENLKDLYDICYPKPPKDVFEQVVKDCLKTNKIWLAKKDSKIIGSVMFISYTKGGHLENLAVHPNYRREGIASSLVKNLIENCIKENKMFITLTTRIPVFFESFGFKNIRSLIDGSSFMLFSLE
tara:strand:+ start:247 stop:654 length:408 start_codon:yes stop_codon:yes gene_type:complete